MLLFMLPYAGGFASSFKDWVPHLRGIAPRPLDVPGRSRFYADTPKSTSISEMAQQLVEPIRLSLPKHSDFSLFGSSMGALLAYEVGLKLMDYGLNPACVFVCACAPPDSKPSNMHSLDDATFDQAVARFGGMPSEISDERDLMDIIRPNLRRDIKAVETYRPRPGLALDCPIHVLGGRDDLEVPKDELWGWKRFTSADCTVHIFPDGHFFAFGNEKTASDYIMSRLRCSGSHRG